MGRIVASDLYPAFRKFLPENELARTLKAFDVETGEVEGGGSKKKARILEGLELVEACQLWYNERANSTVVAANVYPAFRRFLQETGLARTLKAFNKEVAEDEDGGAKPKKAKILAELELTEACQLWYDAQVSEEKGAVKEAAAEKENGDAKKNGGKRKRAAAEELEAEAEADAGEEAEEETKKGKKEKKEKKEKLEKEAGVFFQREDWSKWASNIKDERLKDNTHQAKAKYGDAAGDSWGDKAAEAMIKVKGKGFRKEMQKMKRASWRGQGTLDQGVNSIKFSESEGE